MVYRGAITAFAKYQFKRRGCSEMFTSSTETWRSSSAFIIYRVHWLVPRISWQFNLIVFNDVLLDNGVSVSSELWLYYSVWIEVSLWNESVVAWDMRGRLCRSHRQFVMLIVRSCCICTQFVSRVMTICSHWLVVFSVEIAYLGAVGLTIDAPFWPLWFGHVVAELVVICRMVVRFPVTCRITEILSSFLQWSSSCRHLSSLHSVVLRSSRVSKELRFVHKFIFD